MTIAQAAKRSIFAFLLLAGAVILPAAGAGTANVATAPSAENAVPLAAAMHEAHLAEPLVATAPTTPAENLALAQALTAYKDRASPEDLSSLTGFVAKYPQSGWTPALETNLGISYLHDGYFSKAITAWNAAWLQGKNATDPRARALVDSDIGDLAQLYGAFGQLHNLNTLFNEIGKRPITGSATEAVQDAREEMSMVHRDPRHLFNCGPEALNFLMLAENPHDQRGSTLQFYPSGTVGTNLAQVAQIAHKLNFSYRLVFRKPGQAVPIPSIVHWKQGHFATIIGEANGRYHIEDPVFPGAALWVTPGALDTEASGYFLIPGSAPWHSGWRTVSAAEASHVWGKGSTVGVILGDIADAINGWLNNCPMCGYGIKAATVGVTLSDTPVGYVPPIGPSTKTIITYNQREDSQPAVFGFYNLSPKWTLNWITYVTDDPTNPGASVSRYLSGGGAYYYTGYNSSTGQFAAQSDDGSILVLASQSPITYRRLLPDGSVEIYAQSDGSTAYPRNVFLSQIIDPQGNALTLNYDSLMRLVSLTDATGRQTTFSYNQPAQPLLVTQITDPFGRSATLTYDDSGRLSSITDILGLTSSFTYDANSLVDVLTTPYGTTNFAYTAPGTSGPPRFVQVTDPLGYHEREEWLEPAPIPDSDPAATVPVGMPIALTNEYLTYRDSFYWDKNAYVDAGCTPTGGCDYTQALDQHFAHVPGEAIKSTTIESIKKPLENRIWFAYAGQSASYSAGIYNKPIATGRVLDDGTTQLSQVSYDTSGFFKPTQVIDPVGRTTSFAYVNQVDLSAISQTTARGWPTTIAQFAYNYQHRPLVFIDAAGQASHYTYNAAGQLTSATNALHQTTKYFYNSTGDLTSIVNANGATAASYTYDAFDRVATYTDSEGWTVSYNYDAADRVTKITYPDGTSDNYTYNRLDLASSQDRLGRTWSYTYDADRRMTVATDPVGHQTLYAYNPDGELTSQTDPNGNVTQWAYDVEGRLISKTYADSSTTTYTYENTTSRLKSVEDALHQTKQYSYTEDNRLSGISYLAAVNPTPNVSFAYDPYFARVTSMTDGTGTTNYSYVPVGALGALQLQQDATPLASGTITYAYDALGRVNSRTIAGSGPETFGYDAIGRLTSHASDLGTFTLAYLGQTGQITSRQLASSTLATDWTYLSNSGDRRPSGISTTGLSSGQYTDFAFTTNAENQITGMTQTSDAAISYPPSTAQQTAGYNNLNQITALQNPPPSSQPYSYDADGNLLSDGTRTYTWDAENRLVGIAYPGSAGKATAFTYDGLGRRVQITDTPAGGGTPVTTNYIWCGSGPCQARNSSNAVIRSYYAEGEFVPGSPGTPYYYAPDQLGSVRRVFSAASSPSYDYDSYGNPLQTTATLTDYGYAGLFTHQPSGLYLAQNRIYDPVTGRWLSRDPNEEASNPYGNLYAYAGGNPISLDDPAGLCITNGDILAANLATEIALGGPEDPAADAAVDAEIAAAEAANAAEAAGEGAGAGNAEGLPGAGNNTQPPTPDATPATPDEPQPGTAPPAAPPRGPGPGGGNSPAAARGQQAHSDFKQWVQQQPGWQANPRLTGADGKTYIPDAIDPNGNIVELKPNTPSGQSQGARQLRNYINQLNAPGGRVIYYDP